MSSEPIIVLDGLSKAYPIYSKPADMVWEVLSGKRRHDLFWALKDITFSVREKQRVGIIGPNGAGKSTLLKIITANLTPTSGTVNVNGRISAMLSLISSLNPEESGLSNIRFNLILNGCHKSQIERLTDEIVEFVELGAFIYAPVKTYSSGMNARLAFAIATAIEPEILVVDEVLGVGDGYFVGKAIKRMIDLCNRGKALLYVSHSIGSVQMLCDTAIWMDNGSIRNMGPVDYVTKLYEEDYRKREDETTREGNAARKRAQISSTHLADMVSPDIYRVRIVPQGDSKAFRDTHYIRKMTVSGDAIGFQEASLALVDLEREEAAVCLDIMGSEWGRLYDKSGYQSRVLSPQSGKGRGGLILLKKPAALNSASTWTIQLAFESTSIMGSEQLGVEFLDYSTGNWHKASSLKHEKLGKEWELVVANIEIPIVSETQYEKSLQKIVQSNKPDVEIVDVTLLVNGEETHVVAERQPFEINVRIIANRPTPKADVGLKITRSDGVYVFWQSSGLEGRNLYDVSGEVSVRFMFNQNYLNGGVYHISVICANGWNLQDNYPHSEVFEQKINVLTFTVEREFPILDFGQLNMRVPVIYVKKEAPDTHSPGVEEKR